ncbi:Bacterial Ig-like domain (group 2) [Pelotomaculum sp. FP]|uniref:FN3 associated domain-containing protein n=1 Tax=Pelotomaculum sp. FP TaxID=261474 RepID=UPI0010655678|nr:FN3 associated domain-containing protein [Pelotomaculum sp. FP]TEB15767.1 Bacterial Ig-like domain (group 2) [Pelotomaculum sp. FP]
MQADKRKGDKPVAERRHTVSPRLIKRYCQLLLTFLGSLLLAALLHIAAPGVALAEPSKSVEITGEGVTNPVTLTLEQLQAMEQYRHVYSVINTWPTKKWYVAEGVKLRTLFDLAGLKEDAALVNFLSNDGFEVALTVQELLSDKRYYFPYLMDHHPTDGSIPGSPADAEEVEPILALVSAEDNNDPAAMNDRDSLLLVLGQRVVTEQTNPLFLKYVNRIEVLTTPPPKWENPKADTDEGEVPAGALIRLSTKRNDMDKIYYTTDGSTPTLNSPVFNASASRWWPLRDDLDRVNKPIEINEDTIIKAITIGPGKLNSDVVTFTYKADFTGRAAERAKLPGGPPTGVTLDQNAVNLKIGSTYELSATVGPSNAVDKSVLWSSSDTSVATVDNTGLVTVVGPGTAVITVKTVVGGLTASCVVNGSNQEQAGNGQIVALEEEPEAQEEQFISPVEEPEEQAPVETDMAAAEPKSADENQEEPVEPKEPDEPEKPVENGQYLAEKEALAAASTTPEVSAAPPDSEPVQVYEVSVDAGPAQLQLEHNDMDIYTAGVFAFLFLFGASRRYMEYAREVEM